MKNPHAHKMTDLENVIFVCFGPSDDDDLPQIGDEDSIIVDLMQHLSGKSHEAMQAEFNHQLDPSYQKGN